MMLRIIAFLVVFLAAAAGPVWLLWTSIAVYVLIGGGFEVLAITLLVDGYYGYHMVSYPYYTLITLLLLLLVHMLQPYLSVYNQE